MVRHLEGIVAICVGSGEGWNKEADQAITMCGRVGLRWHAWVVNQTVAYWPHAMFAAVTLHMDEMPIWLEYRRSDLLFKKMMPEQVWGYRRHKCITHLQEMHWEGSSGLFAVQLCLMRGYHRILCCGIPMDGRRHAFRGKHWQDFMAWRTGWQTHLAELKHDVRSFSGWTQDLLGSPTEEWLKA